jgi:hypothetical protein
MPTGFIDMELNCCFAWVGKVHQTATARTIMIVMPHRIRMEVSSWVFGASVRSSVDLKVIQSPGCTVLLITKSVFW